MTRAQGKHDDGHARGVRAVWTALLMAIAPWLLASCMMVSPDNNRLPGQGPPDSGPKDEPNVGPPPMLSGISPSQVRPGETVTIYGRFLYGGHVNVKFPGEDTSKVTRSIDGRRLTVRVPWGARSGEVTVEVDDKVTEDPIEVVILPPEGYGSDSGRPKPRLDTVFPIHGREGDRVTIRGANLLSKKQVLVRFGGTEAAPTTISPAGDALAALIPAGSLSGKIDVVVDGVLSNSLPFTVVNAEGLEQHKEPPEKNAPVIESVFPPHGKPGTPIEVIGHRLAGKEIIAHFTGASTTDIRVLSESKNLLVMIPQDASSGVLDLTVDGKKSNRIVFRVIR